VLERDSVPRGTLRGAGAAEAQPTTHDRRHVPRGPLAIATLILFLAAAWVAAPLWVGLMLGTVMAFTAQPVHQSLTQKLRWGSGVAAATTTLLGGALMACGGTAIVFVLAREVVKVVAVFEKRLASGAASDVFGAKMTEMLMHVGVEPSSLIGRLRDELAKLATSATATAGVILQTTTGALLTLVIALWTMYYTLLDWPRLQGRLELVLPFDPSDVRALTHEFRDVGRSAFIATIGSAVVQGIFAAVGFAIGGVPQPVTWAVLLAITSFIPVIGTALVWFPAGSYLVATGHLAAAVFVWVWGVIVIMGATDYIVRPRLVGKGRDTHPLLTLISLIGGVLAFGLPGLVAGPLIVSLFAATLRIYERDLAAHAPAA
jgi:predicted PurR-regulated permease PerM